MKKTVFSITFLIILGSFSASVKASFLQNMLNTVTGANQTANQAAGEDNQNANQQQALSGQQNIAGQQGVGQQQNQTGNQQTPAGLSQQQAQGQQVPTRFPQQQAQGQQAPAGLSQQQAQGQQVPAGFPQQQAQGQQQVPTGFPQQQVQGQQPLGAQFPTAGTQPYAQQLQAGRGGFQAPQQQQLPQFLGGRQAFGGQIQLAPQQFQAPGAFQQSRAPQLRPAQIPETYARSRRPGSPIDPGFPPQPKGAYPDYKVYGPAMIPDARNYVFVFNDGEVIPYMTKTVAVPVGFDLSETGPTKPKFHTTTGRVIRVFDPSVGRTRNYVEKEKVGVPIRTLLNLRRRLAEKIGEPYNPDRAGRSLRAKLEEAIDFFKRALGYIPMGLEGPIEDLLLASSDPHENDLDQEVIIQAFIPEEEDYEVTTETDGFEENGEFEDFADDGNGLKWWEPSEETKRIVRSRRQGSNLEGVSHGTIQELMDRNVDLTPFEISRADQRMIVEWVKAFQRSTQPSSQEFASMTKEELESMVFRILRYMIAGKPTGSRDFDDWRQDQWASWLDDYLDQVRSGRIVTRR